MHADRPPTLWGYGDTCTVTKYDGLTQGAGPRHPWITYVRRQPSTALELALRKQRPTRLGKLMGKLASQQLESGANRSKC